ncbi:hypothetical protein JCM3766R1_002571 [Sporobolomyces carnicolor]
MLQLSNQYIQLGVFPITPAAYDVLTKKVKFTHTITIGAPREALKIGQLLVWAGQDPQAMKKIFPSAAAAAKDWGAKPTGGRLSSALCREEPSRTGTFSGAGGGGLAPKLA